VPLLKDLARPIDLATSVMSEVNHRLGARTARGSSTRRRDSELFEIIHVHVFYEHMGWS
jgi:hypothetical protein